MIKNFDQNIATLSDHQLYIKIKNLIIRDFINNRDSEFILNKLYNDAALRSDSLYSKALNDAYSIINSINVNGIRSNVEDFIRTDFIEKEEFRNVVDEFENDSQKIGSYNFEDLTGIDYNNLLITKVSGDSMKDAGIIDGDIIFADADATVNSGDIIIGSVNGIYYVKEFIQKDDSTYLVSKNKDYPPVEITKETEFEIKGKVIKILHHIDQKSG